MVIRDSIKIIPYNIHISHIIQRAGCDVSVDLPLQRSKYMCFDKHTLGRVHYVKDMHDNYVKKSGRESEQPEPEVHDEPKQVEPERQHQPEEEPAELEAPT